MPKRKPKDSAIIIVKHELQEAFGERWYHVFASVGRLVDDRPEDESHKRSGYTFISPEEVGGLYVSNLRLQAQCTPKSGSFGHDVYGWEVMYRNVLQCNLRETEKMVVALRIINRRMCEIKEREGYPKNFATAVQHFATAVKATRAYYYESGDPSVPVWDYREVKDLGASTVASIVSEQAKQAFNRR